MNFRSVVIHGHFTAVDDDAKPAVLTALMEHIAKGRAQDSRPPNANELKATTVLGIPLHEAAAKIRNWGPKDSEEDLALPFWAGVLPLRQQHLPAISEPGHEGLLPAYAQSWSHPLTQAGITTP